MKYLFQVELLKFVKIRELPNSWTGEDYLAFLELMDYGDPADIPAEELKETCLMFLSDNEPEEAAEIVLKYIFGDRLTKGQIANLSNEMLDEKMWEEYADLSMHEEFFKGHQLLYEAYNGRFPYPEAVTFQVKVMAKQSEGLSIFKEDPEAPLIRLLIGGMPDNTLIYRLFDENIEGDEFKDARDIIWQLNMEKVGSSELIFEITSSMYWFTDLRSTKSFEARSYADDNS